MKSAGVARAVETFFAEAGDGVAAVYLFGSVARGDDGANSDIDIAVLFTTPPPATLRGQPYDLAETLTSRLGRPVDLTALNSAPVDLRIRVLREGHLVVDRAPADRIRFEVRTRNEFWDIEPRLQEYRRPRKTA